MSYTMLKNPVKKICLDANSFEKAALDFIRDSCQGLRFDMSKAVNIDSDKLDFEGKSLKYGQIPYNMEKDVDRLCLENAVSQFLKTGKRDDAFNVYFCYLDMFIGDYEKTRRMIELLSEFEANGSSLLMRHRDHYSHSVYVFCLELAIYQTNKIYRDTYNKYYDLKDEHAAACHYLQYWGATSLFHDIGYPFELPFEQSASYFEVHGKKRSEGPFMAYQAIGTFTKLSDKTTKALNDMFGTDNITSTDELFAKVLADKIGDVYGFTEQEMLECLQQKAGHPDKFNYFMDHAYFSSTVLFKKLFEELDVTINSEYLDALTAILMHNSLYKFNIAHYKSEGNKPFKAELHPLAYMLMLCDELQCWDRTAYGRNSKRELHPMGCSFDLSGNNVKVTYLYDEKEIPKINAFKDSYIEWLQDPNGMEEPKMKAYSGMFIKHNGISSFQADIERIVDLTEIRLSVDTGLSQNIHQGNSSYLSESRFINLYNFAMILNGRWNNAAWKAAKTAGQEEKFLSDENIIKEFSESFKSLSLEYKLTNINQAKAFAKYMNAIGCFYTDKPVDFELVESFTADEMVTIGVLEHQRWLQEHYDMGWVYGTPEKKDRDFLRQHMDMVPDHNENEYTISLQEAKNNYKRLDKEEQDKDTDPMECMLAMLKMFDGLRIYRLK